MIPLTRSRSGLKSPSSVCACVLLQSEKMQTDQKFTDISAALTHNKNSSRTSGIAPVESVKPKSLEEPVQESQEPKGSSTYSGMGGKANTRRSILQVAASLRPVQPVQRTGGCCWEKKDWGGWKEEGCNWCVACKGMPVTPPGG